jgi:uncharacterized membrane protein YedE/YeeE
VIGRRRLAAFVCGLVFAVGLGLSGMTQPSKVTGFLDVAGAWDPSLICVMGAALGVGLVLFPRILRRPRPLFDDAFHLPTKKAVDGRLLAGAAIFGVGWGLSGYCPGPALVTAAAGAGSALVFALAMAAGMGLFAVTVQRGRNRAR